MHAAENFPKNFVKINDRIFCGGQPLCFDHLSAIASLHGEVVGVINIKSGPYASYHYNKFKDDILKYRLCDEVEVHRRECTFHTLFSKFEDCKKELFKLLYDMKMMMRRYHVIYIHRVNGTDMDLVMATVLAAITKGGGAVSPILSRHYPQYEKLCAQMTNLFKGKLFDMLTLKNGGVFTPENKTWVDLAYGGEMLHSWACTSNNNQEEEEEEEEEKTGRARKKQKLQLDAHQLTLDD